MDRQAEPLFIPATNTATAEILPRVSLQRTTEYDERWLQELIQDHPSVLPIHLIEPAFMPAIPICTELPLASGFLDNLFVTPLGDIIAVECKLWRNWEARRKVVAQIIDYAKDIQALTYDRFEDAICKANKSAGSLFDLVTRQSAESDRARDEGAFVDAVSRNLRLGRVLLLIVGDGISESADALTQFLQQHAGLHFALALVQIGIYDLPAGMGRIAVPSILARTINIVRGIVQINEGRVEILPPPDSVTTRQATTLSEQEFFSTLDQLYPRASDELVKFLNSCEDLQISWEIKKTLIVRMNVGSYRVLPFVINSNGTVDTGYSFGIKLLRQSFAAALAKAIPTAIVQETPKTFIVKRKTGEFFTVQDLLQNKEACRKALEELNRSLLAATEHNSTLPI